MVVASKARQTLAVVQPRRFAALLEVDIGNRTYRGTLAAMQAPVGNNVEWAVGNELLYKHRAYKPAVDAWPMAYSDVTHSAATLHNVGNETC